MASERVGRNKADLWRHTGTGAANTEFSLIVTHAGSGRVNCVCAKYSAAPTQAGIKVVLDSGAGTSYDSTLHTGTANAQSTVYNPGGIIALGFDDALVVTAPAGGPGITAAISVYTEDL